MNSSVSGNRSLHVLSDAAAIAALAHETVSWGHNEDDGEKQLNSINNKKEQKQKQDHKTCLVMSRKTTNTSHTSTPFEQKVMEESLQSFETSKAITTNTDGDNVEQKIDISSAVKHKFPMKLMILLDNCNKNNESKLQKYKGIVSWAPLGNTFIINKPSLFEKLVLPQYFISNGKLNSFFRKLYRWGFTKCPCYSNFETIAYKHKEFIKDNHELCKKITFISAGTGNKTSENKKVRLERRALAYIETKRKQQHQGYHHRHDHTISCFSSDQQPPSLAQSSCNTSSSPESRRRSNYESLLRIKRRGRNNTSQQYQQTAALVPYACSVATDPPNMNKSKCYLDCNDRKLQSVHNDIIGEGEYPPQSIMTKCENSTISSFYDYDLFQQFQNSYATSVLEPAPPNMSLYDEIGNINLSTNWNYNSSPHSNSYFSRNTHSSSSSSSSSLNPGGGDLYYKNNVSYYDPSCQPQEAHPQQLKQLQPYPYQHQIANPHAFTTNCSEVDFGELDHKSKISRLNPAPVDRFNPHPRHYSTL